jgi:putative DNA primase/helicase
VTPIDRVLGKLDKVRKARGGRTARCPAHDYRNPSLSVTEGDDGRVLLNCHADCSFEEIVRALGVEQP